MTIFIAATRRKKLKKLRWIKIIPVKVDIGEIPLYVEILVRDRSKLMHYLNDLNIETRPIYPDLDSAKHLKCDGDYPNSKIFGKHGLVLPCGPDQPIENIERVIEALYAFKP